VYLASVDGTQTPIDLSLEATVADLFKAAGEPSYHWNWLIINGATEKDWRPDTPLADIGLSQEQMISLRLDLDRLVSTVNSLIDDIDGQDELPRLHNNEGEGIRLKFRDGELDQSMGIGFKLIEVGMYDEFKILVDHGVIDIKKPLDEYESGYFFDIDEMSKEFLVYLVEEGASMPEYCNFFDGMKLFQIEEKYSRMEKLVVLIRAGMKFRLGRNHYYIDREQFKDMLMRHGDVTAEEFESAFVR